MSAKRAVFMFLVYLGAEVLGETYDVVSALALAGILILAEQPLQLFQCGFQLSVPPGGGDGLVHPAIQKKAGMEKQDGFEPVVRSFGDAGYAALYALLVL